MSAILTSFLQAWRYFATQTRDVSCEAKLAQVTSKKAFLLQ